MAKFRVSLGKQVSEISFPHRFLATDINIKPPDLWGETDVLTITGGMNILSGEACIPQPSYEIGSMVIPLRADISDVGLYPLIESEILALNVIFDPPNFERYDSQIINIVNNPTILLVPITFEKISIFGMNYADRHWHKISFSEEDLHRQQEQSKSNEEERKVEFVESKKRGRKSKNQQPLPTIWDLLFAILQPPLTFGQTESLNFPNPLYPYQWDGVKFLFDNEHALLADDMGTGKTIMTIVALKFLIQQAKIQKVLVLCPLSVLHQWKEEIEKWAPELLVYLIRNPQKDIRKILWDIPMHIFITTYDTLRSDIENRILPKDKYTLFDVVVLDEAHHIRNPKTKGYRAINKLQPIRRWALTGTPIQNKIEDLVSIFGFVYPNFLTSFDLRPEQVQARIQAVFSSPPQERCHAYITTENLFAYRT